MVSKEDLLSGIEVLEGPGLDVPDGVNGVDQEHENSGADGLDNERAAAAFGPVDGGNQQLPQRGLEEEEQYHRHLPESHREQ